MEGVSASSGGGIDRLESVLDKGGGAMVEEVALGVVGSEVLAHRRGIGPEGPGWAVKGEARAGGGTTVSGAVSMVSVSSWGAGAGGQLGWGGQGVHCSPYSGPSEVRHSWGIWRERQGSSPGQA